MANPDGWGVSYYQENDANIYREPSPALYSPLVKFLSQHSPKNQMVISHLLRASQGKVLLKNTDHKAETSNWFKPTGNTDSERIFCNLLDKLESIWQGKENPSLEIRSNFIQSFADEMRKYGAANFIYLDSITLFAHAHR